MLALTDQLTLPWLYALTVVGAVPFAINLPIRSIVTPFAIPVGLRQQALVDVSAGNNVADLIGALLGGSLVQVIGTASAYAFNAASLVATALVVQLSPELQEACDQARAEPTGGGWSALRRAWSIPIVPVTLLATVLFFTLLSPVESLMPTLAAGHSEGAMALGALLSAIVIGAILGNPLVRRRLGDPRRTSGALLTGAAVTATAVLALGWSDGLVTDMALLVFFGAGWEWVAVAATTAMQL